MFPGADIKKEQGESKAKTENNDDFSARPTVEFGSHHEFNWIATFPREAFPTEDRAFSGISDMCPRLSPLPGP